MSRPGTFRVLMVWLEGREEYADPLAGEELSDRQLEALHTTIANRRRGFVFVAVQNWRVVQQTRWVNLPAALRELWTLPDGQAVDRLIGYDDGPRWVPGIARLEPQESRALRWRVLEYRPTDEMCRLLGVPPRTVTQYVSNGRRRLRALFRAEMVYHDAPRTPVPTGAVG